MLDGNYDKKSLKDYVVGIVRGKIKTLDFYRNFTLEASRDVKKTSKYDSIREEIQEELYHLDRQMATLQLLSKDLKKLPVTRSERVQLGSIVITSKARFYISVSLGEFFLEKDRFYAISPESPMAKTLLGKVEGEEFTLNGIFQRIEKIY